MVLGLPVVPAQLVVLVQSAAPARKAGRLFVVAVEILVEKAEEWLASFPDMVQR